MTTEYSVLALKAAKEVYGELIMKFLLENANLIKAGLSDSASQKLFHEIDAALKKHYLACGLLMSHIAGKHALHKDYEALGIKYRTYKYLIDRSKGSTDILHRSSGLVDIICSIHETAAFLNQN